MELNKIRKSLQNFSPGEETEGENQLINGWYNYFDDRPNQLTGYSKKEKKKLHREIWKSIDDATKYSKKLHKLPAYHYSRNRMAWFSKIAAAFIVTLLVVLPVLYYQGTFSNKEVLEYQTLNNPSGQFSKVVLADGTTVWLSPSSTLRYPKKFGDELRLVRLQGEAFFDVIHKPDKPFIVESDQLQTKVLGTSFNIRDYGDERNIDVTVSTGRVTVSKYAISENNSNDSIRHIAVLTPNQQLVFNKRSQTGYTKRINAKLYSSWKDGQFIFDNNSFGEIVNRLEHWYGVDIHFEDASIKKVRFKISFENKSLEHALHMLQVIGGFKFKVEDNQVWIKS